MKKHRDKNLNLGCGMTKLEGFINIDKSSKCNPDICRDICRGLPFDDNSINSIITSHTLEHIQNDKDLIFIMNECYRVLKLKGLFRIIVPNGEKTLWAWRDPTHYRVFFDQTFWYFCGVFSLLEEDMGITCKFKLEKVIKRSRKIKNKGKLIVDGGDLDILLLK